ncbi:hypothetical protein [Mangrovitalea sediminis]|uniref:hypothetical protein n=1 Tax=Mangrovitalea sediminis TaxID=1982043 RepID=UPI000BE56696|nr:hypothetical protein [Mangrovitalea sediminis]
MRIKSSLLIYWFLLVAFSVLAGYDLSRWKVGGMEGPGSAWGASLAVILMWPLFSAFVLTLGAFISRGGNLKPRWLALVSVVLAGACAYLGIGLI